MRRTLCSGRQDDRPAGVRRTAVQPRADRRPPHHEPRGMEQVPTRLLRPRDLGDVCRRPPPARDQEPHQPAAGAAVVDPVCSAERADTGDRRGDKAGTYTAYRRSTRMIWRGKTPRVRSRLWTRQPTGRRAAGNTGSAGRRSCSNPSPEAVGSDRVGRAGGDPRAGRGSANDRPAGRRPDGCGPPEPSKGPRGAGGSQRRWGAASRAGLRSSGPCDGPCHSVSTWWGATSRLRYRIPV